MGINEIEKIAGITGLDGSGKQTLTYEAAAQLAFADKITIDGVEYENKDVRVIVTSFPEYTFLGNLIRRSFSDVGDRFFEERGIDLRLELNLRKSLFALDRLMTLVAIKSIVAKNTNKKYIWLSDRLDEDQVNTIAYVLNKHGRQSEFEELLPDLLDADYYLRQMINPTSIICFPNSVANLAQFDGTRKVDIEDRYESIDAQTLASVGYEWVVNNIPNNHKLVTQNEDGKWKNKEELVAELLSKIGVRLSGRVQKWGIKNASVGSLINSAMLDGKIIHVGVLEMLYEMYPILRNLSNHREFADFLLYANEWHLCNFYTIEEIRNRYDGSWNPIPDLIHQDKKSVMRIFEESIAQFAGAIISELRVSNKFKESIDPLILNQAFPFLFGEYTQGQLLNYIIYLSEHTGDCISYPDIIRDIAPWVRKYEI